jgi:DNA-binding beta-propeller fold protein YncE
LRETTDTVDNRFANRHAPLAKFPQLTSVSESFSKKSMPPGKLKNSAFTVAAALAGFAATFFYGALPARAGDAYKWSVQYLIDNSRSVFGRPQSVSPRHNRGLAISPDGKFLYAGYHHSFNNAGEVRRIQIDVPDYERATVAVLPGLLAKGIACDDKGRVYITDTHAIQVYDATLKTRLLQIPTRVDSDRRTHENHAEGNRHREDLPPEWASVDHVATTREGGELVLYGSNRDDGTISRWVLKENGDGLSSATLGGFGGTGVFKVPGALDLRGLKLDPKGNIWVVDLRGSKVFKIKPGGADVKSVDVNWPMDVAIDGQRVFVTRWRERAITVLDDEMNVLGNLGVPWEELELSPFGNNHDGFLSGIVVVPGRGFFVANEGGQTANQKSTYGQIDEHSDVIGGKLFHDAFMDDNEPILRGTEVTTAP